MNKQVRLKIIGYSKNRGNIVSVEVIKETNKTITVKWGDGSRKFSKRTGYKIPRGTPNIWSEWRLEDISE